jgi:7-carboxy-7-deazaguanine synthase (Cx14CxxC type)
MSYTIKEIRYTLQGEGVNTGRPAVLLRFSGCNLWSGREEDRDSAMCNFCDTDIVGSDGPGGGNYATASELVSAVAKTWPRADNAERQKFVVCTGGEPSLQLDSTLVDVFHERGFEVAIETNGTVVTPPGVDWICVSPKAGTQLWQKSGDELKLVYPQVGAKPEQFEELDFRHFFLQPLCGPDLKRNTNRALRYCMDHPKWRLSVQTHKILGIP